MFAVTLHLSTVRAESIDPERPATGPLPVAPELFVPAPPALFGPSQVGAAGQILPMPSPGSAGGRVAPDQGVGSGRGEQAAELALQYVGAPYRWGGASPAGFDCSGFVLFVYGKLGVSLPHDVLGQLAAGRRVAGDALHPGDVLVFQDTYRPGPSHNGIYLGEGRFVHAADERRGVTISLVGDGYWAARLYGSSRPNR